MPCERGTVKMLVLSYTVRRLNSNFQTLLRDSAKFDFYRTKQSEQSGSGCEREPVWSLSPSLLKQLVEGDFFGHSSSKPESMGIVVFIFLPCTSDSIMHGYTHTSSEFTRTLFFHKKGRKFQSSSQEEKGRRYIHRER